jgi:hypothetical protein
VAVAAIENVAAMEPTMNMVVRSRELIFMWKLILPAIEQKAFSSCPAS